MAAETLVGDGDGDDYARRGAEAAWHVANGGNGVEYYALTGRSDLLQEFCGHCALNYLQDSGTISENEVNRPTKLARLGIPRGSVAEAIQRGVNLN
jgi:hypothetical protein